MNDHDMIRRGDALDCFIGLDRIGDVMDYIAALPAVQVGVKPLEWVEIRSGQYFEARVIGILYSVRLGTDGIARWQAGHMGTWHEAPTIEAAKAAAQADYDARIRSALTAQSSPDVAALVEALREANGILEDALQEVGDDYPGSNCQAWCQQQVKEARAALARVKGDPSR